MQDYISNVKERVQLREGTSSLEKILTSLYIYGRLSNKDLSKKVFLPIPVVTAIKKEFIKEGIMIQDRGIQLTELGRQYVEKKLGYEGLDIELYKNLMNSEESRYDMISELCEEYTDIYDNRPQVNVEIDQALGTVETAFKRAMLCLEKETLINKKILCVGDDDFISVALGLLLKRLYKKLSCSKKMLSVFDIDERIVENINSLAEEYGLPIEALHMNLRDPLPINYASCFDAFFTDPPYTMDGLSLFLSRGISALKKEKGLKVFLSFGQKPINEVLEMQEIIGKHGLVINNIMKGFNHYNGAALLGSFSEMLILETTDSLKTIVQLDETYKEKIYTADFRNHVSVYECKNCKHTFKVGKEQEIRTIEELKKSTCPYCGENTFILQKNRHVENEVEGGKKSLGQHVLADFFECDVDVLGDVDRVKEYMHQAARRANATIVTEEFHKFNPWGVSGAVIIMESHLTIHTWPEYGYAAVDIFTCGKSLLLWEALSYLKEKLGCKKMEYNEILRGKFKMNRYTLGVEKEQ